MQKAWPKKKRLEELLAATRCLSASCERGGNGLPEKERRQKQGRTTMKWKKMRDWNEICGSRRETAKIAHFIGKTTKRRERPALRRSPKGRQVLFPVVLPVIVRRVPQWLPQVFLPQKRSNLSYQRHRQWRRKESNIFSQ